MPMPFAPAIRWLLRTLVASSHYFLPCLQACRPESSSRTCRSAQHTSGSESLSVNVFILLQLADRTRQCRTNILRTARRTN